MSKIIIHIEDEGISHTVATGLVKQVMTNGFLSGEKQYCWVTTFLSKPLFEADNQEIAVISMKTRGDTHTFKVRLED